MRFITEILVEGVAFDLYDDKPLSYKLQVNKISDLKDRQASFLKSTNVPRTAKNVRIAGGLGLSSDTSSFPYTKPNCQLKIDGYNLIVKGWINITETADDYKITIFSGIVEFFKAIEGKKVGTDLDLTEINHAKNLTNVVSSFTSPFYRYLITDYNGKTHYGPNNQTINIDYLVPSVSVKYLWDKIHSTFGFTYSGSIFDSAQFNNLFITYPKPIPLGGETELKNVTGDRNIQDRNVNSIEQLFAQLFAGGLDNNISFKIPNTGTYRIVFEVDATFGYQNGPTGKYLMSLNQIGVPFASRTNPTTLLEIPRIDGHYLSDRVIAFQKDDVIDFYNFTPINGNVSWNSNYRIKIIKIDDASVSFTDELKDFAISDFIKDIFNMFGLTPFSNELNNNIDYKLITERLATAPAIDWSKKFVRRIGEKYVYDSFAQANYFRYQYNDKESTFHDAFIAINNPNLNETKDIFKSKMYSPEKVLTNFYIGSLGSSFLRVFKMYEKEVKESGGTTTVNYKGLDKRFHYARSNSFPTTVQIGSETLQQETTVNVLPLIDFTGLSWSRLLATFYYQMGRVLMDSRAHVIELNLNPTDVLLLDQSKMYYFEQEQQYYVIDSIEYDGDQISKGTFIRVKRDPDAVIIPEEPTQPEDYDIGIKFGDDSVDPITGYATSTVVKLVVMSYPSTNPIVSSTWQIDNGSGYIDLMSSASPFTVNLQPGLNSIRLKGTSQSGASYFSEVLEYTRLTAVCVQYRATSYANSGDSVSIFFNRCSDGVPDSVTVYAGSSSGFIEASACAIQGTATSDANVSFIELGSC